MVPKFRAYDTKNKVMITNFHRSHMKIETGKVLYQLTTTNENEIKAIASYNTFDDFIYRYSHDLELMQSTGLKDKNGVEIFEGDVIGSQNKDRSNWYVSHHKIVWHDTGFVGKQICSSSFIGLEHWTRGENGYVVIGNIYENPELLEQANE
ncbi:YopX family protein [Enterococcus casseliflavus]|uniref:YopX family protein n=1 Tax=Enterococcus casseliflavus TaxID=37734 RepID=UPI003EDFEA26